MDNDLIKRVGMFCRDFRIDCLGMTLVEFSEYNGLNYKNVNAFEYGRANNIIYLFAYYRLCNDGQKKTFTNSLFRLM